MIGKDKTGKYHPPKGKPSGSPKKGNDVMGKDDIIDEALNAEKRNNVEQPKDIHLRHYNRHQEKDQEEKSKGGDKP